MTTFVDYSTIIPASWLNQVDAMVTDAELIALASTVSAADTFPYYTGSGIASTTPLSSTARTLLSGDAPGMRTTLGLGTAALNNTGDFVATNNGVMTGVPVAPTAAVDTNTTQVATTAYVIGQAYAKLASPALTGTPTAPTAGAGTSSTQLATTAFVGTASALYTAVNAAIDGGMMVNRGAVPNLSTSQQYGSVDMYKVGVSAGTVSAGTITQTTTSTAGRTGYALLVSGASLATTPTLSVDHFIESRDAVLHKNQTMSFGVVVYHDVGSSINYTIQLDKANAQDNFGAVTNVTTSGNLAVANTTATLIKLEGVSVGDISNGLRVRINAVPGTTTTKNFHYTELMINDGAVMAPFPYEKFEFVLDKANRYFRKSFPYATAPAQNAGVTGANVVYQTVGAAAATAIAGPIEWGGAMRAAPTMTFYNPSATNAVMRNTTVSADTSANGSIVTEHGFSFTYTSAAGSAINNANQLHWIADARF